MWKSRNIIIPVQNCDTPVLPPTSYLCKMICNLRKYVGSDEGYDVQLNVPHVRSLNLEFTSCQPVECHSEKVLHEVASKLNLLLA